MQTAQKLYEGVDLGAGERGGSHHLHAHRLADAQRGRCCATPPTDPAPEFGPEYTQGPRRYKTAAKSAQEAHQAIRPLTCGARRRPSPAGWTRRERALYDLIWRRTLASQMTDAVVDSTAVDLAAKAAAAA